MTTTQATDRRSELLKTLGEQVEALINSEAWQRWMDTAAKFHSYSLGNQLLIACQRPNATRVAGYRKWQEFGRQVRKGERGIAILAPMVRKSEDEAGVERRTVFGFKVAHVFDVSQTDGEPLAEVAWPILEHGPEGLYERLTAVAGSLGLTVETTSESHSGARGWYEANARRLTIVDTYPAASMARTMLHELAHSLDPACNGTAFAGVSRSERELVAESVAYIVGKRLGLDTDDCSTVYVASWGADAKTLEKIAGRVLAIAGELEQAIGVREEVAA